MEDKHLNIFCSYSGGRETDLEHTSILEDNLTRALIITLKHLPDITQRDLLKDILGIKKLYLGKRKLRFDLQSINPDAMQRVQNSKKKVLLVITRDRDPITKSEIASVAGNLPWERLSSDERGVLLAELRRKYIEFRNKKVDDEARVVVNGYHFGFDTIQSVIEALRGARPDGWIYLADDLSILIEAKIGEAKACRYQLYRHLRDKHGFNLAKSKIVRGDYRLVNATWSDFVSCLSEIAKEDLLGREFRRYCIMAGQELDLSFIVEDGYDAGTMRQQFPLFLDELDAQLDKVQKDLGLGFRLHRANRPLSGLWDYYGVMNPQQDKVQQDPHISIAFDSSAAIIEMTVKTRGRMRMLRNLFSSSAFREYLEGLIDRNSLDVNRYFLSVTSEPLLDGIKGQMRGERWTSSSFSATVGEIGNNIGTEICLDRVLPSLVKGNKQFAFGYKVESFDPSQKTRRSGLKAANASLYKKHENLVQKFGQFSKEILPIMSTLIKE